ncbi:unnamed protein product, partial [Amoebophrya sp. A120]
PAWAVVCRVGRRLGRPCQLARCASAGAWTFPSAWRPRGAGALSSLWLRPPAARAQSLCSYMVHRCRHSPGSGAEALFRSKNEDESN